MLDNNEIEIIYDKKGALLMINLRLRNFISLIENDQKYYVQNCQF